MPLVFAPCNVPLRVVRMHLDGGGSVIVRVKEGRLALDRDMATRIFVAVKEA